MKYREPRLPSDLRAELDGLDWKWVIGSKHWKLMVDGQLVAIWPRGSGGKQMSNARPTANIRAQIRRFRRTQVA